MNSTKLLIATITLTFSGTPQILKGFVGESIAVTKIAYTAGTYGYDYLYNTEDNQTILKKHLKPGSNVASGCEKNLSQACIALANHYRKLEAYHKISYLKEALTKTTNPKLIKLIKQDLALAQEEKIKLNLPDDNGSYLESLSSEEEYKALEVARALILENKCLDKYAEELDHIYKSLDK